MATVLVVEDDDSSRDSLVTALSDGQGLQVFAASSGEEAIARLKLSPVDIVISDIMMGRLSGIDLLQQIRNDYPDTTVILMTAFGSIDSAVKAMRLGAYDYITKPFDLDRLEILIDRAVAKQSLQRENRQLRKELSRRFSLSGIIGQSAAVHRVLREVEQVAPTNATVLILGDSGTGKELIAKAIHHHSHRADARMVSVNCAALPESVVESELFGHERGSFTGAHSLRKGRFELANKGTLFLDEVGDLSQATQVKLLRVLQEREIERVGGQHPIPVDVRLIAATNRDLEQALKDGNFREDLYYRLRVVTIEIPPLCERREDIPLLLDHFVKHFNKEHGKAVNGFSAAAKEALCDYAWPGNVRELRNMVESLVITTSGDEICLPNLPSTIVPDRTPTGVTVPMGLTLSEIERVYTLRTLQLLGGNKSRAAQVLGIGKKTLYRRLQEYGVFVDDTAATSPEAAATAE